MSYFEKKRNDRLRRRLAKLIAESEELRSLQNDCEFMTSWMVHKLIENAGEIAAIKVRLEL